MRAGCKQVLLHSLSASITMAIIMMGGGPFAVSAVFEKSWLFVIYAAVTLTVFIVQRHLGLLGDAQVCGPGSQSFNDAFQRQLGSILFKSTVLSVVFEVLNVLIWQRGKKQIFALAQESAQSDVSRKVSCAGGVHDPRTKRCAFPGMSTDGRIVGFIISEILREVPKVDAELKKMRDTAEDAKEYDVAAQLQNVLDFAEMLRFGWFLFHSSRLYRQMHHHGRMIRAKSRQPLANTLKTEVEETAEVSAPVEGPSAVTVENEDVLEQHQVDASQDASATAAANETCSARQPASSSRRRSLLCGSFSGGSSTQRLSVFSSVAAPNDVEVLFREAFEWLPQIEVEILKMKSKATLAKDVPALATLNEVCKLCQPKRLGWFLWCWPELYCQRDDHSRLICDGLKNLKLQRPQDSRLLE